ncbi:MAG TPA: hemolysin family protein [Thermoanaerobaculia bacterium]|nr:hemolysin family protein [Thermoanaerobaculia bacterium]
MDGRWLAVAAVGAMLGAWLLSVLAALLERSGPIRLRHWAQESGSLLRNLYGKTPRFEAFRFLLSLCARLMLVAFYALTAAALLRAGVAAAVAWAFLPLVLLIGAAEVVNRHLVGRNPEAALRALTPFFRWMAALLGPLLALVAPVLPRPVTEEVEDEEASRAEIDAFIDVGRKEGILEPAEEELVRGVVDFGDTQVHSVMTPRIDMVAAPLVASPTELAELVLASGHSRIPIYRDSVDEVVGIVHVRELLRSLLRGASGEQQGERTSNVPLAELLQAPHFVPETKTLGELLRELQDRHQEMAIVVDEYGGTQGLVTVEDLLEEVFGEMGDTADGANPQPLELPDGSWRLDGRTHLEELERLFPVVRIPDDAEWETVGGLIFGHLAHVPRVGETVDAYGLRFTVEGADHRRARRVRVELLPPTEEEAESA